MSEHVLEREQLVAAPPEKVFAFFALARNLERLTPPWLRFSAFRICAVRNFGGWRVSTWTSRRCTSLLPVRRVTALSGR